VVDKRNSQFGTQGAKAFNQSIDRTPRGCLSSFVYSNQQKAPFPQVTTGLQFASMSGPLFQEAVDLF
tara:strand:- start:157 stop:357 length:201 start_codon:yes stop_codon:yes gene_type:complete